MYVTIESTSGIFQVLHWESSLETQEGLPDDADLWRCARGHEEDRIVSSSVMQKGSTYSSSLAIKQIARY
jgi:hypothetical protein